ncbi:hypothetical protein IW262DRAFT_1505547 [Armillaria fumosa]|nr:hypothetical protein IW262DRAFT_1505547 [Armillaria fumosa]
MPSQAKKWVKLMWQTSAKWQARRVMKYLTPRRALIRVVAIGTGDTPTSSLGVVSAAVISASISKSIVEWIANDRLNALDVPSSRTPQAFGTSPRKESCQPGFVRTCTSIPYHRPAVVRTSTLRILNVRKEASFTTLLNGELRVTLNYAGDVACRKSQDDRSVLAAVVI